jgi:hypothetical protein
MTGSAYCEHNRVPESCEDCVWLAGLDRGNPHVLLQDRAGRPDCRAPRNVTETPVDVTPHDLHVERKDLGEHAYTLVREGDTVPAGLRDLPRRKASEATAPAAPRKRD